MPSIDLSMPEQVHAVAFETYAAWSEGGQKLSKKSIEALATRLLEISADLQQLWYAAASLGALALTFEAEGDGEAAQGVRELVARQAPHFRPILEELEGETGEARKASAAAFSQMFGGPPTKTAPRHDEAAPEGSVSLKSLLPNPALGVPRARPAGRGASARSGEASSGPRGSRPRRGRIDLGGPSGPRGPRGSGGR